MHQKPTINEDMLSQIPALKLLVSMGWQYISPDQALEARGGRSSNVLLEEVLRVQLDKLNSIEYQGHEYPFSAAGIEEAILAVRELPVHEGYIKANQTLYELLTLGKSIDQRIGDYRSSFTMRYIDWEHPENNSYHVTEEFSVLRHGMSKSYRPDLVLFVNGIPLVVIECKSPSIKQPIDKAIEQHLRNQEVDGIRSLYQYSALLMALSKNEAMYATTGTSKAFWSVWKEMFPNDETRADHEEALFALKQEAPPADLHGALFRDHWDWYLREIEAQDQGEKGVTFQDRSLYGLCRPERLLELMRDFTVYDNGEKKVARYQQYFAVKNTLRRIATIQPDGKRRGGVIWQTQGSGKSLTMVMLAQLIANHPDIKNPRIVLVTDRIDLDDQISDTFKKCEQEVRQAKTGASALIRKKLSGARLSENELKN
ncbi:MAG: type I restriction endonuclease [Bacteroidia bacterium]